MVKIVTDEKAVEAALRSISYPSFCPKCDPPGRCTLQYDPLDHYFHLVSECCDLDMPWVSYKTVWEMALTNAVIY